MHYLVAMLVAGLLIAVGAIAGCGRNSGGGGGDGPAAGNPAGGTPGVGSTDTGGGVGGALTRDELARRLGKLARSSPPAKLKPGAMCYEMAAGPARLDYVCPDCGAKTLYALKGSTQEGDVEMGWDVSLVLSQELPACRRAVKTVAGLDVSLDESEFCRNCRPDVKSPALVLVVRHPDAAEPHRARGINQDGLRLIRELLAGKETHTGATDDESALKDHMKRLIELLGVGPAED